MKEKILNSKEYNPTPRLSEIHIQPRVRDQLIFRLIILGLTIAFLALTLMIYWALVPINVIDVKNTPSPIRPTVIDGTDYVIAHFDYCKYIDVEGEIRSFLISDKTRLVLPISIDRIPKGCKEIDAPIAIPPQTTSDTYHYHYQVTYRVNPLREVVEEFDTQNFKVVRVGEASPSGQIRIEP